MEPPSNLCLTEDPCKDEPNFEVVYNSVKEAISMGIHPVRISQGSSGSYFVRNSRYEIVGVFKPRDEEPYAIFNPKWIKWLHRTICPCLFGRPCLFPNQGYLSEAGASIVDRHLKLNIVPVTKIVEFSSTSFNYGCKYKYFYKNVKLPEKVGSLQLYMKDYIEASALHTDFSLNTSLKAQFIEEFQKLTILDYIIRNTDRGNDNWLVKIYEEPEVLNNNDHNDNDNNNNNNNNTNTKACQFVRIAAIDNGLSFPYKHPDPFHWVWLSYAKTPYTETIISKILPLIKNNNVIKTMQNELLELFCQEKAFTLQGFIKQMSIMHGQIINLIEVLEKKLSPFDLVMMPPPKCRTLSNSFDSPLSN
ncbi:phosphatidylinositol 4-kinase type 2-beta-like [Zophobas morio]|uniref:phosphatidylinositol 4-kinase type 2-beta-like n=1 Tax=Zophobas morio TaxID=2755281 RepID=UPI0030832302